MIDQNETTASPAATSAPAAPRRRGPRMDKLAHVRRGLSRVYRDLEAWRPSDLKPAEVIARSRALGGLLTALADVMRADDLEKRLAALEDLARVGMGRH